MFALLLQKIYKYLTFFVEKLVYVFLSFNFLRNSTRITLEKSTNKMYNSLYILKCTDKN